MLNFILTYGGTILASITSAAIIGLMKWFISNQKRQQKIRDEELIRLMNENIDRAVASEQKRAIQEDKTIQASLEIAEAKLENLTRGLLSIQGKQFRADCRELLEPEHQLTQEEFLEISADHEAYNALGGNHTGDMLFDAVRKKFNATFGTSH